MSILDAIVRDTREALAHRRTATPQSALEARCRSLAIARDLEDALRPPPGGVRLIAEVKKASPSRGVLAPSLDPVALATRYAAAGAHAISVLTDEKYFQGHLDLLPPIRAAVDVPLLRKDFLLDEYHLWEARAASADAVLLIVAILPPPLVGDLLQAAKGIGLAALVECHTAAELEIALGAGARIIGINNRDLASFETRIETTLELLRLVPPGPLVVSESGFFTGAQVRRVVAAGVHAVLVGEALVRAADVAAKIQELTLGGAPQVEGMSRPSPQVGGAPRPTPGTEQAMDARPIGGAGQAGGEMGGAPRPTHCS